MPDSDIHLAALRKKIDDIDNQLLDLLMSRAAIGQEIGRAKGDAPTWRPAREAQVLRRLTRRPRGPFPARSVVRIWREVMSAVAGLQNPLSVAVYAPGNDNTCRELARDHFGAETSLFPCSSPGDVIEDVRRGNVTVGVLPKPGNPTDVNWWVQLAKDRANQPLICADLPFGSAADMPGRAVCIASIEQEESGKDRSLITVQANRTVDRTALDSAMQGSGLAASPLGEPAECGEKMLFLFEIEGFVSSRQKLILKVPDTTVFCLGSYAVPFSAAEIS